MPDRWAILDRVPEFTIRVAVPEDGPAIAHVQRVTWTATYHALIPGIVAAFDPVRTAESWARAATAVAERVTVAVGRQGISAYAWSCLKEDGAELAALYVLPSAQGQGVGRALVLDALEWAASASAGNCEVWALAADPAARGFYERQGFVLDPNAPPRWWKELPEVRYSVVTMSHSAERTR